MKIKELCEYFNRFWTKREYGTVIYYENSDGIIVDNRNLKVELTLDEIANKFNIPVSQLKIKKE